MLHVEIKNAYDFLTGNANTYLKKYTFTMLRNYLKRTGTVVPCVKLSTKYGKQTILAIAENYLKETSSSRKCLRPCSDCPFLTGSPIWLEQERRQGIHDDLTHDGSFPCHKTIDYSNTDRGEVTKNSKLCVGSALYLEKNYHNGARSNVQYRMRFMLQQWTLEQLENSDLNVIATIEEWLGE